MGMFRIAFDHLIDRDLKSPPVLVRERRPQLSRWARFFVRFCGRDHAEILDREFTSSNAAHRPLERCCAGPGVCASMARVQCAAIGAERYRIVRPSLVFVLQSAR